MSFVGSHATKHKWAPWAPGGDSPLPSKTWVELYDISADTLAGNSGVGIDAMAWKGPSRSCSGLWALTANGTNDHDSGEQVGAKRKNKKRSKYFIKKN